MNTGSVILSSVVLPWMVWGMCGVWTNSSGDFLLVAVGPGVLTWPSSYYTRKYKLRFSFGAMDQNIEYENNVR